MRNTLILLVFAVLILAAGSAYAQDVVATQQGPNNAMKGETITITYTITNNGNQPIYDVMVSSQNFDKDLGTIGAGEKKTFTEKIKIPTDAEVKADFGSDATVSNPFYIGGVGVSYQDANGNSLSAKSNSLSIPLVSSKSASTNNTNNNTTATEPTTDQGILQQIIDFINSIIQFFANLF
jgi:hypothetical protein